MGCCGLVEAGGGQFGLLVSVPAGVEEGQPRSHCQDLQGSLSGSESAALIAGSHCEYQETALTHSLSSSLSPSLYFFSCPLFSSPAISKSLGVFTSVTWRWQVGGGANSTRKSLRQWIEGDSHFQTVLCVLGSIVLFSSAVQILKVVYFLCGGLSFTLHGVL